MSLGGATGEDAHDHVVLEMGGVSFAEKGTDAEAVSGEKIEHGPGVRLHSGVFFVDIAPGVSEDGDLRLAGIAGGGDAVGKVNETGARIQERGGVARVAVNSHAISSHAFADVHHEHSSFAAVQGGQSGRLIGRRRKGFNLFDGGLIVEESFAPGMNEGVHFVHGPVVVGVAAYRRDRQAEQSGDERKEKTGVDQLQAIALRTQNTHQCPAEQDSSGN